MQESSNDFLLKGSKFTKMIVPKGHSTEARSCDRADKCFEKMYLDSWTQEAFRRKGRSKKTEKGSPGLFKLQVNNFDFLRYSTNNESEMFIIFFHIDR